MSDKSDSIKLQAFALIAWIIYATVNVKKAVRGFKMSDLDYANALIAGVIGVTLILIAVCRKTGLKYLIPVSYIVLIFPPFLYIAYDFSWAYVGFEDFLSLIIYEIIIFLILLGFKFKKYNRKIVIVIDNISLVFIASIAIFMFSKTTSGHFDRDISNLIENRKYEDASQLLESDNKFISKKYLTNRKNELKELIKNREESNQKEFAKNRNSFVEVKGGELYLSPKDKTGLSRVSDYYISKYEVTVNLWEAAMGFERIGAEENKEIRDKLAKGLIRWYEAVEFCNKLSELDGLEKCYTISDTVTCDFSKNGFRLPTEAEWVFAAIGGNNSKKYKFSGSDNYMDVIGTPYRFWSDVFFSVADNKANELGIYGMSGGVGEWCWDWSLETDMWGLYDSYEKNRGLNPTGPQSGRERVYKGTFADMPNEESYSPYFRASNSPDRLDYLIGLRLVRTKID